MFENAQPLRDEFAALESALGDPETHADLASARRIGRRYAELTPIVKGMDEYERLAADLEAARELAESDESFAIEATELSARLDVVTERLTRLLAPRDPNDTADALVEIKSGEGGEESALFAGDLLKMYTRYAEARGWKVEVLDAQETDLGGYKSVTVAIKAPALGEPDQMPYGVLKFEGGVHRVQRVPVTESQGRVHTSAAGVLVMPDVEEAEVEIDENDLRIDVYRSSGPGGQGVNTTDSAVRITHLPSGIVVSCQNERSQLQNREQAMRMLRARLTTAAEEEAADAASAARRSQVRTVDRSERIRTYNFPENRISDHRIGFKAYNLDQVLNGELAPVITALQQADIAERLALVGSADHFQCRQRPRDGREPQRATAPRIARRSEHQPQRRAASVSQPVRPLLTAAADQLRAAGVESAAQDARVLLSFVSGVELVRLPLLTELDDDHVRRFRRLVAERAERVPLQHLTGRAHFRRITVEVGPGVFVPRPETEVMTGWAIERLASMITLSHRPLVVELGTGSGAIAKAIADELTRVDLYAVERSEAPPRTPGATWPTPWSSCRSPTWRPRSRSWTAWSTW